MERRPDPQYDFNEPALSRLLRTPPFSNGNVIVGLLFVSPGKHAEAGTGDVATIIAEAMEAASAIVMSNGASSVPAAGAEAVIPKASADSDYATGDSSSATVYAPAHATGDSAATADVAAPASPLHVMMGPLLGEHENVVRVLMDRLHEGIQTACSGC